MPYVPKTWVAGEVITAADLNNIEGGVDDANAVLNDLGALGRLYTGKFSQDASATRAPSGWTITSPSAGLYLVTHNLGTTNYVTIVSSGVNGMGAAGSFDTTVIASTVTHDANSFSIRMLTTSTMNFKAQQGSFLLLRYG